MRRGLSDWVRGGRGGREHQLRHLVLAFVHAPMAFCSHSMGDCAAVAGSALAGARATAPKLLLLLLLLLATALERPGAAAGASGSPDRGSPTGRFTG